MDFVQSSISSQEDIALSNEILTTLWHKAFTALQSLQGPLGVMAGGQDGPFHTIFGRDSLWTVLLALEAIKQLDRLEHSSANSQVPALLNATSYHDWLHELAASVLRGLAALQGQVVNDVNEEQPGRIVHEYWDPVPQRMLMAGWPVVNGRYYGGFDTTFLYIVTATQVEAFFNDRELLEELWPHIHAALRWMLDWADLDQDYLVEYSRRNPDGRGLVHQVWKDSTESLQPHINETLIHPYAWIEVQGYALGAFSGYLKLASRLNRLDPQVGMEVQRHIEGLKLGLARFWMADERFPAMALDGKKQPVEVISSNAGHLLWSEAVEQEQAGQICQRLMQPDMLTPWGIRTLSERAYFYNPYLYHAGTIWPFDNAIIAAGMQRYGFNVEARRTAQTILNAIGIINDPVELYMVLPSQFIRAPRIEQPRVLVDYYYSSRVQAWTTSAILYLVTLLLEQ